MTAIAPHRTADPVAPAPSVARSLVPLAVDIAIPVAAYFLARDVLGLSLIGAFVASSVVPVLRTAVEYAQRRRLNTLALVVLLTNIAAIALTFVTGDLRIATAKSAAVSGVVALGFVVSALRSRPALSAGMRPYLVRGDVARDAAWDRLQAGSPRFRMLQNRFTAIYGIALLAECTARLAVAAFAPVSMLGWLPTVLIVAGIAVATIVGGGVAADPARRLLDAEVAAGRSAS